MLLINPLFVFHQNMCVKWNPLCPPSSLTHIHTSTPSLIKKKNKQKSNLPPKKKQTKKQKQKQKTTNNNNNNNNKQTTPQKTNKQTNKQPPPQKKTPKTKRGWMGSCNDLLRSAYITHLRWGKIVMLS